MGDRGIDKYFGFVSFHSLIMPLYILYSKYNLFCALDLLKLINSFTIKMKTFQALDYSTFSTSALYSKMYLKNLVLQIHHIGLKLNSNSH